MTQRVDLIPTWVVGSIDLTQEPYSVDRGDTVEVGEPAMVVEESEVGDDGSTVRIVGTGNRTYSLVVYIEGASHVELAENEAILRRELQRPDLLLTHDSGDEFSVPSVYVVRAAMMTPERIDAMEGHCLRKFTLTLTCAPWARSVDRTTVEALPIDDTTTTRTIDNCTSTVGWTGTYRLGLSQDYDTIGAPGRSIHFATPGPAVSWASGNAVAALPGSSEGAVVRLDRTGAMDLTDTPYLVIHAESVWSRPDAWFAWLDDQWCPLLSVTGLGGNGYRLVFRVPGGKTSASKLTLERTSWWKFTGNPVGVAVYDVSASSMPATSTPRQWTHILDVGGTERAAGTLQVANRSAGGLGLTLAHSSPYTAESMGYEPGCAAFRVGGNEREAATFNLSSEQEPLHPNPVVFDRPDETLPEGTYAVAAIAYSPTATTERIYWTIGDLAQGFTDFTFTGGRYDYVPLTVAWLPTVRSSAPTGVTRIEIQRSVSSSTTITLDDLFLFWMGDDCGLTVIHDADRRVAIESSAVSGKPSYWTGSNLDGSDRRHPGARLVVPGSHVFSPGQMRVWTGTRGAIAPAVAASFFKRWHTNAAE